VPKLTTKQNKAVDGAKEVSTSFEAWPKGKYIATLAAVEEREGKESGNKYWSAEFCDFTDLAGEKVSGRQWLNIMLPITKMPEDYLPKKMKDKGYTVEDLTEEQEEARQEAWDNYQGLVAARIKEFFGAFGFTPDSDTDEVVGEQCVVLIGQETQQMGRNAGKIVNTVNGLAHLSTVGLGGDPSDSDF
jgi:hypothetical protein